MTPPLGHKSFRDAQTRAKAICAVFAILLIAASGAVYLSTR